MTTDISSFVILKKDLSHVSRKENDIRIVYNGSKSGQNKSIFAPQFNLPSSNIIAQWVLVGSWLGENDFQDFCLNHKLHSSFQNYCGIDISILFPEMKRCEAQMLKKTNKYPII